MSPLCLPGRAATSATTSHSKLWPSWSAHTLRASEGSTVAKDSIFVTRRIARFRPGTASLCASVGQRISRAMKFSCSRAQPPPPFTTRIVEARSPPAVRRGPPSRNPTSEAVPILIASRRPRSNGNRAFPSPISTVLFAPRDFHPLRDGRPSRSFPVQKAAGLNACASKVALFQTPLFLLLLFVLR